MSRRIIVLEETDLKDLGRYAMSISGCQVISEPSFEMVERAARVLYDRGLSDPQGDGYGWDHEFDEKRNICRRAARAALTAALFGDADADIESLRLPDLTAEESNAYYKEVFGDE